MTTGFTANVRVQQSSFSDGTTEQTSKLCSHNGWCSRRVGYNPYTELDFEQTGSESDDSDTKNPDIMSSGLQNVPADELFTIEKIWAKKVINSSPFYLIQWAGFAEMTWEPRINLPWRAVVDFERENKEAVWVHLSA